MRIIISALAVLLIGSASATAQTVQSPEQV